MQYSINVGILRPHQFCEQCQKYMTLKECPTSRFTDGFCWVCEDCQHTTSVRAGSILSKRRISFSSFLNLLWLFCTRISVCDVARILSLNTKTVWSIFKALRQCIHSKKHLFREHNDLRRYREVTSISQRQLSLNSSILLKSRKC